MAAAGWRHFGTAEQGEELRPRAAADTPAVSSAGGSTRVDREQAEQDVFRAKVVTSEK
jgi:hypothetical protein